MHISNDYSYIGDNNLKLTVNGYGKITAHSIHFDRYYSEKQKEQNRQMAETMTKEEWSELCSETSRSFEKPMKEILDRFKKIYNIHQVSEETSTLEHYRSDWDLFFNSDKGWNRKPYMTCFTLSFNENRSPEQNKILLNEIFPLVDSLNYQNIGCRIQYDVVMDKQKIRKDAAALCETLSGKFISYQGMTGKIKAIEENGEHSYGFFEKFKKTNYYNLSLEELLVENL